LLTRQSCLEKHHYCFDAYGLGKGVGRSVVSFGLNVDPANPYNRPDPFMLRDMGCRWVRLVSRPDLEDYVDECHDAHLAVLSVVTEQSGGYLIPAAEWTQIGNEPDVSGTTDSMSAQAYVVYWNLYRQTYPDLVMIGAGLASGQSSYWQQIQAAGGLQGASGFSVHPYNKTAAQAESLLKAYQKITPGLQTWVTEWHRPTAEVVPFATMLQANRTMHAWYAFGGQPDPQFNSTPTQLRALAAAA
jgi:hypothetical protein